MVGWATRLPAINAKLLLAERTFTISQGLKERPHLPLFPKAKSE